MIKSKNVILEAIDVCKDFGSTKACKDISLSIKKGEIHGLIGENGSGKSTFVSMLCGVQPLTSGEFLLEGKNSNCNSLVSANYKGISMIVQEMGTLDDLTVAQNIFLGKEEQFTNHGILNMKKLNLAGNKILNDYGFGYIKARTNISNYNFEIRKLIEIAKSTYFNPKILVIDETSTALSQDGRNVLYQQIKKVKENGNSVILISHDLQEVLDLTDRISVLRDGKYIDTVNSSDSDENSLKHLMVGREIEDKYYRIDFGKKVSDEVVLSAQNISVDKKISNISLEVHKGEILGIGGLSDCGMHELAKSLFGASFDRKGEVFLSDGTEINDIYTAIKNDMAYTSKDRDNESIMLNASIKDNICLLSLDKLKNGIFISPKKEEAFAQKYANKMSVKMENVGQFVSDLSGGNKQKVVLSRWLGRDSKILILDSPTRGIDVKVKADIYSLMAQLKEKGHSIIMISEEIMELIGMCDRILILKNGKLNGEFTRSKDLTEHDLIQTMV